MKEIKFRAWIKSKKKYIYIVGFCFETKTTIRLWYWKQNQLVSKCVGDECQILINQSFSTDEIKIEQYIGLEDMNKKEIYEDDLFETEDQILLVHWNNEKSLYEFLEWNDEAKDWYWFPENEIAMWNIGNMLIAGQLMKKPSCFMPL